MERSEIRKIIEAERIAGRLAEAHPEVRRVILFGSVADGTVPSERFGAWSKRAESLSTRHEAEECTRLPRRRPSSKSSSWPQST